jgi:hypothetical protein
MPDDTTVSEEGASEQVEPRRPVGPSFVWSAAPAFETRPPFEMPPAEGAAVAPERDGPGEGVELDVATDGPAETTGEAPIVPAGDEPRTPASDRAVGLESEHWRERAIVWRERAMGAELVAKMVQRNLDDLRANLEDLRARLEVFAAAEAERQSAIASSESPWRRFTRDMYRKYLG